MPGSSRTLSLQTQPHPLQPLPETPRRGGRSSPAHSEGACRGFACNISALSSCTRGSPWHTATCWLGNPRARAGHQGQALGCSWLKTLSCLPEQSTDTRQGLSYSWVQGTALPLSQLSPERGGQHQAMKQLMAKGLRHIKDLWMGTVCLWRHSTILLPLHELNIHQLSAGEGGGEVASRGQKHTQGQVGWLAARECSAGEAAHLCQIKHLGSVPLCVEIGNKGRASACICWGFLSSHIDLS